MIDSVQRPKIKRIAGHRDHHTDHGGRVGERAEHGRHRRPDRRALADQFAIQSVLARYQPGERMGEQQTHTDEHHVDDRCGYHDAAH